MLKQLPILIIEFLVLRLTQSSSSGSKMVPEIIIGGIPRNSSYSHQHILASIFKKIQCDFVEVVVFKTRDLPTKSDDNAVSNITHPNTSNLDNDRSSSENLMYSTYPMIVESAIIFFDSK